MEAISMGDSTTEANRVTNEDQNVDQPTERAPNETGNENSVATDENPFAKNKRKRTSKVWNEFKEIMLPDGTIKAECVHCKTRLGYNKTGATTQYNRHLKICTMRQISLKGQKQLSLATVPTQSDCISVVQNFKYDQGKIREALAHMIMVHELPFSFVEYDLFNHFMRTTTCNWEKISRATAKKDCLTAYEIEKKKIKTMLSKVSRCSITTDLWKSDQNIQYMVVTCHFVDENYNLQKRQLNFVDIPPPHTGIVVCDALKKCLVEWGVENKVWTVTVDNASYNDVAVDNLRQDLSLISKLPLEGKFFHVRCCAHILNILVQYGLTEIEDIIYNIRESVKYIGKSVSRLKVFTDIADQLKLPRKKLILDCGTRWNATYMMLAVALEYKDVFPRYKVRDESYHFLPSEIDWNKAAKVCSFLEEFDAVTTLISGSEYPTSNLFLPELWNLKQLLDSSSNTVENILSGMVNKMKQKFDKYWGDNNLLICLAAIMDPRNKMKLIEFTFHDLYPPMEAIMHEETIRAELRSLFNEYVEFYKTKDIERPPENSTDSSSSHIRGEGLEKGKGRGRNKFDKYIRNVDNICMAKSELDIYLDDGVVLHNDVIDPPFDALKWWKENSNKYRILSIMDCDIISIPITTVASESAFSAGGRIIDPHRASLGTDTVQILTCGSDWIRALYGIKRKDKDVGKETNVVEFPLS